MECHNDIFDAISDVWKSLEEPVSKLQDAKMLFFRYNSKEDSTKLLSSAVNNAFLFDSKLNKLHCVSLLKDGHTVHHVALLTPQPIDGYTQMAMSNTGVLLLASKKSVGIVYNCISIGNSQSCKKVIEVFDSADDIISIKWYPNVANAFAVLTRHSINIILSKSDKKHELIYSYRLEDSDCVQKSFGFKDEYSHFDFGTARTCLNDNLLFILSESGNVFVLPEIAILDNQIKPDKLRFDPHSSDNYGDDFVSLHIIRGFPDVLVMANAHGAVIHAFYLNNRICVYEYVCLESNFDKYKIDVSSIVVDDCAYPPRYLVTHSNGIYSCILPWVVRVRAALQSDSQKLSNVLDTAGETIIDNDFIMHQSSSSLCIDGIHVNRVPLKSPELCLFLHGTDEKRFIRIKLRQESFLMANTIPSGYDTISIVPHQWPDKMVGKFFEAIMKELGQSGRLPAISLFSSKPSEDEAFTNAIFQISFNLVEDYAVRLNAAGIILDDRAKQLRNVVQLQIEQLGVLDNSVSKLARQCDTVMEKFRQMESKQQKILSRLSNVSKMMAVTNSVTSRSDLEAIASIRQVRQKIDTLGALIRSCQHRFDNCQSFFNSQERSARQITTKLEEQLTVALKSENDDISRLVTDLQNLST